LDKYPDVTNKLIPSALRNEQHWYKTSDRNQDEEIRKTGTLKDKEGRVDETASIGPAQIQIQNIRHLISAAGADGKPLYPFLQHMKDDPLRLAEEPKNAALLAGAYFADKARELTKLHIPVNDKTLAYCWNPDVFVQDRKYVSPDPTQLFVENHTGMHKNRLIENALKVQRKPVYKPVDPQITEISNHVRNVMGQYKLIKSSD
jgi:hypothetical protein